jgi:hypothetical protein
MIKWWPVLLGPLGILYVYAMDAAGLGYFVGRHTNELAAMPIIGLVSLLFWTAAIRYRSEFHLVLAVLTLGFFFREWHFEGTGTGVYAVLLICLVWAALRRGRLKQPYVTGSTRYWLVAALTTYLLSQLIARRVFSAGELGWLPYEHALHISLEETVENLAHLMMLVTSIVSWPGKKGPAPVDGVRER